MLQELPSFDELKILSNMNLNADLIHSLISEHAALTAGGIRPHPTSNSGLLMRRARLLSMYVKRGFTIEGALIASRSAYPNRSIENSKDGSENMDSEGSVSEEADTITAQQRIAKLAGIMECIKRNPTVSELCLTPVTSAIKQIVTEVKLAAHR